MKNLIDLLKVVALCLSGVRLRENGEFCCMCGGSNPEWGKVLEGRLTPTQMGMLREKVGYKEDQKAGDTVLARKGDLSQCIEGEVLLRALHEIFLTTCQEQAS